MIVCSSSLRARVRSSQQTPTLRQPEGQRGRPVCRSHRRHQSQGGPAQIQIRSCGRYEISLSPYRRNPRGRWLHLELRRNQYSNNASPTARKLGEGGEDSELDRLVEPSFADDDCIAANSNEADNAGESHEVFEVATARESNRSLSIPVDTLHGLGSNGSAESDTRTMFRRSRLCSAQHTRIIDGKWIPGFLRTVKLSVEEETRERTPSLPASRGSADGCPRSGSEFRTDPSLDYAARRIRFDRTSLGSRPDRAASARIRRHAIPAGEKGTTW